MEEQNKTCKTKGKTYSDQEIVNAITEAKGNISKASKILGMSSFLYQRVKKSPEIMEQYKQCQVKKREEIDDILFEMAKTGDIKAIRLFMEYNEKFTVPNYLGIKAEDEKMGTEVIVGFKTIPAKNESNNCPDGSPLYDLDVNKD